MKKMRAMLKQYMNKQFLSKLIFDPHYVVPVSYLLLILEFILNVIIIEKVKYTEIDWIAYMQEVEGFLNGTLDYKELRGDTGPLVYPAGFVYMYTILYYITCHGKNIYVAQYIFLMFYLIQTYLYYRIIRKTSKIPPYALILVTVTSYRIHSIFVLRLFNDPIAVLFFYVSLNCFISNKWILGSLFYSLAVSVKMNILLYAPCLLIAYLTNLTLWKTIFNLFICGLVQLILGAPFLYENPISYLKGSFDLGRIFEHKWTVNYRFLSRNTFENRIFHLSLIALHIILLLVFFPIFKKYFTSYAKLNVVTIDLRNQILSEKHKRNNEMREQNEIFLQKQKGKVHSQQAKYESNDIWNRKLKLENNLSKVTQLFVLPFFVTNLIGISCARSLHYQFYSWYFHSLLYLVFSTGYRKTLKFLLLGLIEYCWNVYPSSNVSSILLHLCHIVLLFGLYRTMKT